MYLEALLDFLHEHVPVGRKTVDGEYCAVRSTKESKYHAHTFTKKSQSPLTSGRLWVRSGFGWSSPRFDACRRR
jgi:hypothetical protein